MSQPDDSDAFRVGDLERERAVAALHDAVGGGYLDLQEYEERSQTVYAAKTRGDRARRWRTCPPRPGSSRRSVRR